MISVELSGVTTMPLGNSMPSDGVRADLRVVGDDLAVAVDIDRDDFVRAPVAEPQPILVPPR
ncbi:MAG: hypothetical protein ABJA86_08205 [Nocardioidaceae bacterium]